MSSSFEVVLINLKKEHIIWSLLQDILSLFTVKSHLCFEFFFYYKSEASFAFLIE